MGVTVHRVELSLLIAGGLSRPVPSTLRHEADDPYAIHVEMTVEDATVEWTFARDLLTDGLARPAGLGDVRIHPCTAADGTAVVHLELGNSDGHAVLQASATEMARFLDATHESVPPGSEPGYLDIDATLTRLLAGC